MKIERIIYLVMRFMYILQTKKKIGVCRTPNDVINKLDLSSLLSDKDSSAQHALHIRNHTILL